MEEYHVSQVKALTAENEDQRSQMAQMEKEMNDLRAELEAQKEANVRSPSNTMKNLMEQQKAQLTQKEKQLKVVVPPPSFSLKVVHTCKVVGTQFSFSVLRKCFPLIVGIFPAYRISWLLQICEINLDCLLSALAV